MEVCFFRDTQTGALFGATYLGITKGEEALSTPLLMICFLTEIEERCEEKQTMMRYKEEKEAKKEAFRKYLESSGAVDALTKVLVALYEQNDKPSSAVEFIQQKLSCPSISEYEKLQAELSDLQIKYHELLAAHQKTCKELEEMKNSHALAVASTKETTERESPKDGL
ncbi:hypothetical protein VNO77_18559 [Canavalia gladiata]|uniref:c-Myc-binding protein n=1 Tax=Canavalia gladiata TaxID=3824 RepID=A0AAN9LL10_CANGL